MKLGFIRLGKMGTGIVHNFRAAHKLTVYNRTRAKAEDFASEGARVAPRSPASSCAQPAQLR